MRAHSIDNAIANGIVRSFEGAKAANAAVDTSDSTLAVMMGNAPSEKKPVEPKAPRKVTPTPKGEIVVELQVTGTEYWHLANVIRGDGMILGVSAKGGDLSYAVQVIDGNFIVFNGQGERVFEAKL